MFEPVSVPEHVIAALQAGREVERNFEIVFRAFYRNVTAFFERHGLEREQSRDLTQEVFLVVFANVGSLQNPASFRGWLFGIARNKLLHQMESLQQARKTA